MVSEVPAGSSAALTSGSHWPDFGLRGHAIIERTFVSFSTAT